jgi:hypothetical protein
LVANARSELRANKNSRPSTEYSIQDIAFTFTNMLPSWVYPHSVWKEDVATRRRHIARVLRSSPLIARPRALVTRDKVVEWAKRSEETLTNEYITTTTNDLESLLASATDFVASATDVELMDPLFLSAGYLTLDNAINDFIIGNHDKFTATINEINHDFNHVTTLSGELRTSLESMREDVVSQTKYVRNQMFEHGIEHRLRHLGHHIRSELQNLLQEVRQTEQENHPEASKILRKHTADSLRTEIQTLDDIKVTLVRSKSILAHLWDNATDELVQSPAKVDYWVDVAVEIKEAIIELGRFLTTKKKHFNKKQNHCTCGYNN